MLSAHPSALAKHRACRLHSNVARPACSKCPSNVNAAESPSSSSPVERLLEHARVGLDSEVNGLQAEQRVVSYVAAPDPVELRHEPEETIFVEVKSSKDASLTPRERGFRKLVQSGRVRWLMIHVPSELEGLKQLLTAERY